MSDPTPKENGPPFDRPDADIIIRSSNQVDFRVHKVVLKLASPVFESMFLLPQDNFLAHEGKKDVMIIKDDLQVVQLPHDSQTLSVLLRICYPAALRYDLGLEEIGKLLRAIDFYQMDDLKSYLRHVMSTPRFLDNDPLRVYVIACRWGWKDLAEDAAFASLAMELVPLKFCPEMNDVPASVLVHLINYRHRCCAVSKTATGDKGLLQRLQIPGVEQLPTYGLPKDACVCSHFSQRKGSKGYSFECWTKYLEEIGSRMQERPCRETVWSSSISPHVQDAVNCRTCLLKIIDYIPAFREKLWDIIEKEIREVKLEFVSMA